jgi:hypothetical protein
VQQKLLLFKTVSQDPLQKPAGFLGDLFFAPP